MNRYWSPCTGAKVPVEVVATSVTEPCGLASFSGDTGFGAVTLSVTGSFKDAAVTPMVAGIDSPFVEPKPFCAAGDVGVGDDSPQAIVETMIATDSADSAEWAENRGERFATCINNSYKREQKGGRRVF